MKKITILLLAVALLGGCTAKAVEGLEPGNRAPEFTLTDIDGNAVALSGLEGKVTVLDFWGSWCIWCIRGIPDMKATYEKYNGELQIVGIACHDKDDEWRAAVAEHRLPWLQLFNGTGENDIAEKYAVRGYPTKIILNERLEIVEVFEGESPEFYSAIDSLMTR